MLNAAILGLGWWGRTIVQTMRPSDALRVVAGVDPAPHAASACAELGIRQLPDFAAALADPAIDTVILCTPHTQHAAQIQQAAAAGKHVFCEKPLCLTLADAQAAIAACNRHNVTIGVGHERRFEPAIADLRALIAAGGLGTLLQMEGNFSQDKFLTLPRDNWRLSPTEAPAGPMTATGIHLLDLAVSFLGPAERALVHVAQLGSDLSNGDTLAAMIRFRSGANALLTAILATPFDGRLALYGSEGWAEIRDKAHPEAPEGWTVTTVIRGEARVVKDYPPASSVRANLEAFAAQALGRGVYPMPQSQMLATIAALEAVFRSAVSGEIVGVAET
jgi:predicted dehydrogenase